MKQPRRLLTGNEKDRRSQKTSAVLVGVARLELAASWSRTMRATICATPRDSFIIIISLTALVKQIFLFAHICSLVQI